MLAKQPKKTPQRLLAAACVALVAAGVVALLARQADEAQPHAPSQTVPPPTNQTIPPTQPRMTPTTVSPPDDSEIASSLLLSGKEYGSDWVVVPNGAVFPTTNSAIARWASRVCAVRGLGVRRTRTRSERLPHLLLCRTRSRDDPVRGRTSRRGSSPRSVRTDQQCGLRPVRVGIRLRTRRRPGAVSVPESRRPANRRSSLRTDRRRLDVPHFSGELV